MLAVFATALSSEFSRGDTSELEATRPDAVKNVLFIVSDDLKASVLGCYGDPICQTPNIDRLAKRGMVFDHAYCQGTWCAPSRQSFMFSRYEGKDNVNLGQLFKDNGWYSARVGKIYHMKVPGDIIAGTDGQDVASSWTEKFNSAGQEAHTPGDYACLNLNIFSNELENRQSTAMPHRMFVTVQYDGDGSDQPDAKSASTAIELLSKHRDEKFFLAVGLVRPHYPMVAPREYFSAYPWQALDTPFVPENDLDDIPKQGWAGNMSTNNSIGMYPDNQRRMWAGYYAAVSFMDKQVGRILDQLDELGLSDSTAVVFTSDHGYHLGEHHFWEKSNLHEQVIRVPLIVALPGRAAGRSSSLVELVDIYPTLAEAVGLEVPKNTQGKSLLPILADAKAVVRQGALSLHNGTSLRTSDFHYIRYPDGSSELYDMKNDPGQLVNLAGYADYNNQLDELAQQLDERLAAHDLQDR
jgi:iduronate 2-sulfatase